MSCSRRDPWYQAQVIIYLHAANIIQGLCDPLLASLCVMSQLLEVTATNFVSCLMVRIVIRDEW